MRTLRGAVEVVVRWLLFLVVGYVCGSLFAWVGILLLARYMGPPVTIGAVGVQATPSVSASHSAPSVAPLIEKYVPGPIPKFFPKDVTFDGGPPHVDQLGPGAMVLAISKTQTTAAREAAVVRNCVDAYGGKDWHPHLTIVKWHAGYYAVVYLGTYLGPSMDMCEWLHEKGWATQPSERHGVSKDRMCEIFSQWPPTDSSNDEAE